MIEDRERANLAAEFKREKSVSERRRTDETKILRLHSVQESCVRRALPYMWCVLHTGADKAPVYGHQLCGGEKLAETIQNAQLRGSWFSERDVKFPVEILSTGEPRFTIAHITIFRFYDGPVLLPIGPVSRFAFTIFKLPAAWPAISSCARLVCHAPPPLPPQCK